MRRLRAFTAVLLVALSAWTPGTIGARGDPGASSSSAHFLPTAAAGTGGITTEASASGPTAAALAAAKQKKTKCLRGSRYSDAAAACGCRAGYGSWMQPGATAKKSKLLTTQPSSSCDGAAAWKGPGCACKRCPKGTTSVGNSTVRESVCYNPSNGGGGGGGGAPQCATTGASYFSVKTSAPSQSWRDAAASNACCEADATGNYNTMSACTDALPVAGFASCANCSTFSDADLISNVDDWAAMTWSEVAPNLGMENRIGAYLSPLQMAKIWLVATAKYASTPVTSTEPVRSVGGPASCVASLTVSMQEGGNGASQVATFPYHDSNPLGIYDPNWNIPDLCRDGDRCISGGPWQVSSAWVDPTTCAACDAAGCRSLKNPVCAARISFEYARWIVDRSQSGGNSCVELKEAGGRECTAAQFNSTHGGVPCFNGPFCLQSSGWTSEPCKQIYRQAWPNKALPYCRMAIKACALAKSQLAAACDALGGAAPAEVCDPIKTVGVGNPGIEAICPSNPGPWYNCPNAG